VRPGVSVHALTSTQHDLIIRPLADRDELGLFCRFPYLLNEELADDLDQGRRQLDWLWMALRGGELLARAAWWKRPEGTGPLVLDIFDIDDGPAGADPADDIEPVDLGVRLLREAMAQVVPPGTRPPEYGRSVPADWRDHPEDRRAVENRMTAIERLGGQFAVERHRLNWQAGTAIPDRSGRLRFTPVSDEHELIGLMTAVLEGTLDAHSREDLDQMPPEQVAVEHYQGELALFRTPREWWQVARLPDGAPVGFVIPAHNGYNPIIAYLGVLPAHRGHGYIDEILAEGTRILAAGGAQHIRASTDLGNVPMARAFHRAGWTDIGHEINMTWT
jgi:RimJ/RimL family protein N-acetyltransferase